MLHGEKDLLHHGRKGRPRQLFLKALDGFQCPLLQCGGADVLCQSHGPGHAVAAAEEGTLGIPGLYGEAHRAAALLAGFAEIEELFSRQNGKAAAFADDVAGAQNLLSPERLSLQGDAALQKSLKPVGAAALLVTGGQEVYVPAAARCFCQSLIGAQLHGGELLGVHGSPAIDEALFVLVGLKGRVEPLAGIRRDHICVAQEHQRRQGDFSVCFQPGNQVAPAWGGFLPGKGKLGFCQSPLQAVQQGCFRSRRVRCIDAYQFL